MGNSPHNLHEILVLPKVQQTLCCMMPSLPIRLMRSAKSFSTVFSDEKLAELLPNAFETLTAYNADPFSSFLRGDVESAWLMLVHGLDPRVVDHTGESLLQAAIRSGSIPTVHMLLERGFSVSSKGAYGYTPLHQVAYTRNVQLCEFLLEQGANLDALSMNGSTPLLIASREGQAAMVQCMLQYGADPMDGGDKGLTPLLLAAAEGHSDILRLLVEYGADINEPAGVEKRTPLHEAVEGGHTETCLTILRLGGIPSVQSLDSDGASPVDVAMTVCRHDIVELLTSYEDLSPTAFSSKSPLDRNRSLKRLTPPSILPPATAS